MKHPRASRTGAQAALLALATALIAAVAAGAAPLNEAMDLVRQHYYRPEQIPSDQALRGSALDLDDTLRHIDGRLRLTVQPPGQIAARAHTVLRQLSIEIVEVSDASITITALPGGRADRSGLSDGAILYRIGTQRIRRLNDARQALAALGPHDALRLEYAMPDWRALLHVDIPAPPEGWFAAQPDQEAAAIKIVRRGTLLQARILRFEGGRTRAVLADALKTDNAALLLDLRHCSGGSLKEALAVAAMLLPAGTKMGEMRPPVDGLALLVAHDTAPATERPVLIAIDRYTASAAEVLTAILGRTGRAKVLGERSSGKCVAERAFTLSDGTALEIPVSEFVPPDGDACNNAGVTPSLPLSEMTLSRSEALIVAAVAAVSGSPDRSWSGR